MLGTSGIWPLTNDNFVPSKICITGTSALYTNAKLIQLYKIPNIAERSNGSRNRRNSNNNGKRIILLKACRIKSRNDHPLNVNVLCFQVLSMFLAV